MSRDVAVNVLIAGDDEADLDRFRVSAGGRTVVVRGLAATVAALRAEAIGVLLADVAAPPDGMALLRAAGRGRPPVRCVVLLPAHASEDAPGVALIRASAFAVRRHPVAPGDLEQVVVEAAAEYACERAGRVLPLRPPSSDQQRWARAERDLTLVLRRAVEQWAGAPVDARLEAVIERSVVAAGRAAREAQGNPELLATIARTLATEGLSADDEAA